MVKVGRAWGSGEQHSITLVSPFLCAYPKSNWAIHMVVVQLLSVMILHVGMETTHMWVCLFIRHVKLCSVA